MTYLADERDVHFNLFEYVNIGSLANTEFYGDQSEDMYKMVIAETLKFAQKEIDPLFVSGDREGCKKEGNVVKAPKGYKETYAAFAANGFLGMDVPATYGGQNLPTAVMVPAYEFFTGANVAFSMYVGLTRGAAYVIENYAEEKYKKIFCEKMYTGIWGGTMCLTEPHAGTSVGDLKTTAKKNADGTYSIKGNKIFISSGDHDLTENNIHLVLARVEGDPAGTKGISLFIVPKIWANEDGSLGESNDVNCVNVEHKLGIKAQATCSLNFGEAGKCRGYLVGEQAKGMRYMFQLMNEARLLVGIQGLSIAGTAYLNAVKYAKDRVQGSNTTIVNYPDVRRNLALMKAICEGMRGLLFKTAFQLDMAKVAKTAEEREKFLDRVDLMTPVCKAYCSDQGFKVTEIAMQVLGGAGYTCDYPMEQYMRDVKIASIYEGANGIQALDLLGRKLPSKGGQLLRDYYEEVSSFIEANINHAELKGEIEMLKKAVDTVGQVAMKIAEWGMSGNQEQPMLSATPFLEILGHATLAGILLEQAVLASKKIGEGSKDVYYPNKIKTAQFFARQFLPVLTARAKAILSEDKTALEIEF